MILWLGKIVYMSSVRDKCAYDEYACGSIPTLQSTTLVCPSGEKFRKLIHSEGSILIVFLNDQVR